VDAGRKRVGFRNEHNQENNRYGNDEQDEKAYHGFYAAPFVLVVSWSVQMLG
jgi:hypothetical protein